ncbi:GntR family transcriptional regulator [Rhodococcus rhodochrous]|uniref:GntR family transcriptional regulator n=1 Tax=Rhodococcus rhodochrous TaxID=1829 RepID=A0AAW4XMY6_RHORH|nr:FCD domain-containing protein [Rhodococcus rhodochrous]MCD2114634.1 GntR family transcriptional regulator [Rhodococcus rhodochrous]
MTEAKRATAGGDAGHSAISIAGGGSVLRPLKAAEVVARAVVRTIRSEGLQTGDSLPSEAEMLPQYGVSRESLREGLRLLEVQGMISIRRGPGGGPIVGTVDSANLGRMEALYLHLAGASYDELFDAWVFAETTLAGMAAANPDADARKAAMAPYIEGLVDDVVHDDLDVYMSGHEGFHGSVAALAGNRVFQVTFRAYGQIVAHHLAMIGDVKLIHQELVDDHLTLAQVISEGDSDAASKLMNQHLTRVLALNRAQLGSLLDGDVEWI